MSVVGLKTDKTILRALRGEFHLQPGVIYMDGNSLGLASKAAERSLREMLDAWKRRGIDGWLRGEHSWYLLAEKLGAWRKEVGALCKRFPIYAG